MTLIPVTGLRPRVRVLVCLLLILGSGGIRAQTSAVPIEAWLEDMPLRGVEARAERYGSFNRQPVETARALAERLTGGEGEDDTAACFAIDGWTTYVLRPGAEPSERTALAAALLEALEGSERPSARPILLSQLGKVGVPETVAPLGRMLADPELAQSVALALQAFALPACRDDVLDTVRRALPLAEGHRRAILLQMLGDLRDPNALALVKEDLATEDADIRGLAVRAVALSGNPDAVTIFQTEAGGRFFGDYARSLARRGHREAAIRLCRNWVTAGQSGDSDHRVCMALVALDDLLGSAAFDDLSAALDDSRGAVRATAGELLVASDSPAVSPWLKQRLDAEAADERAEALALLARRGDGEVVPIASRMATDEDAAVRHAAYEVLGAGGGEEPLLRLYGTANQADRPVIRAVLLQHHGRTIAARAWEAKEASMDPRIQAAMLELIGYCGDRAYAEGALASIRSGDPLVAEQAVKIAQGLTGPDQAPAMLVLLQDTGLPPPIRSGLVAALVAALNEGTDGTAPIAELLPRTEGDVREDLHRVLGEIREPEAVRLLAADAEHPSEATRDSAVRTLCKWDGLEAADPLLVIAGTTTNQTHHVLALRRMVQLVQQYRAGDPDNQPWLEDARRRYEAALAVVRRDEEKILVEEALAGLTPEPEPTTDVPQTP